VGKFKKDFGKIGVGSTSTNAKEKNEIRRISYPLCQHLERKVIHHLDVGEDQMLSALCESNGT